VARRVEVITGRGDRRRWSDEEKARAIEASLVPGAVVSAVARRHGVTPQQLFTWRREAQKKAADTAEATPFVPAIVEVGETGHSSSKRTAPDPVAARPHSIELDIDGTSV
jgi:transposase